jgi:4-amino-4-deoxy-L-arabinose transferase-like glycosyltransferase
MTTTTPSPASPAVEPELGRHPGDDPGEAPSRRRRRDRSGETGQPPHRSFGARIVRGAPEDPAWARPALLGLLAVAAVLYLWDLSASGYANSFYAAAAQAASVSWKAMFYGSFDSSSFITVDKPPAALWVMGLSGRIFGFSSWSMLGPQALEGVAAVGVLYAAVKRWHGPQAGLFAGAALMLTPAAALIFRFNNPDALLVLLLTIGAYCMVRAVEAGSTKWILFAGSAVGFGFLTKMLQAFLVVPAFGLVYLVCAPTPLRRRLLQLVYGLVAMIVSAGWWIAIVELVPKADRPYVGGSTNDNILELVFGYNGLSRLFGGSGNGGGGGGGNAGSSFGGSTGLSRLFSSEMGNEISWLLPAALIALVAGLVVTRRAPRTDRTRASLILWGGWLLVTGLTFSYMKGTIHPYYTIALAPAIAALVAVGGHALWVRRQEWSARAWMAAMVFASGLWSYTLLARDDSWHPEVRYLVLVLAVVVTLVLLIPGRRVTRSLAILAIVGAMTGLVGTSAYAVATASTAHTGSIPSVGPSSAASSSGGGFGGGGGTGGGSGTRPSFGSGTAPGSTSSGSTSSGSSATSSAPTGGGGMGGGGTTSVSSALTTLLKNAGTKWAAATVGSQNAASLQLSSDKAIMAIGGFTGSDPAPTLAQFEAYVKAGQIRYFITSGTGTGTGGGGGGMGGNSQIATWVAAHYTATTVGGMTVYDLQSAS